MKRLDRSTMYGGHGSYSSPPAELSNNPFLEHSSNPLTRYPDISGATSPTNPQFTSWIGQPNSVPQQQGYDTYSPQYTQQQQHTAGWGGSPTYQTQTLGYPNPPQQTGSGFRFQPSSSFGQQLSSAVEIGGFIQGGVGYQQQTQPQPQSYGASNGYNTSRGLPGQPQIPPPPYQQTGVTSPTYLPEFDPYASIGQGAWDGGQQQPQQQSYGNQNNGGALNSQPDLHPREVIRKYKADLEAWDTYSWKQLMNSLESLKKAWERRMLELDARTKQPVWGMAVQQELVHYQNVSPPSRRIVFASSDDPPIMLGIQRRGTVFL